jgi:hypothetical protein
MRYSASTIFRYIVSQEYDDHGTYSSLAHLRIDIICPALNACLHDLCPDMMVRDNANAHPCLFDKGAQFRLVFNIYNLDCYAVVSYSITTLCS